MKKLFFRLFVCSCACILFAGCVFSWKPVVSDSSVNVSDKTDVRVPYEKAK